MKDDLIQNLIQENERPTKSLRACAQTQLPRARLISRGEKSRKQKDLVREKYQTS